MGTINTPAHSSRITYLPQNSINIFLLYGTIMDMENKNINKIIYQFLIQMTILNKNYY